MTPQQIDAMKLALGQLQAGFVGNAMQILREALAEHAMQEVQRLGQEIEPDDIASILACRDMLDAQPVPPCTEQESVAVKHMKEWVEYLKRKSDFGQHMKIPSEMSAGTCWELANELEQFINTTPPQCTWVGLTDDEKNDCLVSADPCEALAEPEARQLIEDVEQALKERNQ